MKNLEIILTGVEGSALLTHNERLANKQDDIARQMKTITSLRAKTDEHAEELARLEFIGGLYLTDTGHPGIPTWNIFRSIQDGAKMFRLGRQVERGLFVAGPDVLRIEHDGPSTAEAMYAAGCFDQRSVKVGTAKVTRTRPIFRNWSVTAQFVLDNEALNDTQLEQVVEAAGRSCGIGDYRPRFGRYTAIIKEI